MWFEGVCECTPAPILDLLLESQNWRQENNMHECQDDIDTAWNFHKTVSKWIKTMQFQPLQTLPVNTNKNGIMQLKLNIYISLGE